MRWWHSFKLFLVSEEDDWIKIHEIISIYAFRIFSILKGRPLIQQCNSMFTQYLKSTVFTISKYFNGTMPLQLLLVWYALCWIILHEKSRMYARWGSCILKVSCKKKRKKLTDDKDLQCTKNNKFGHFLTAQLSEKMFSLDFSRFFLKNNRFWTPIRCSANTRRFPSTIWGHEYSLHLFQT